MELIAEHRVHVTHPDKLLWPELGITKADFIQYLIAVSPWLLPYLVQRTLTLIRYPDGIHGHFFYQKNAPTHAPQWINTAPIWSQDRNHVMHGIVVDSVSSLIWLGNMSCLEFHVGFTTVQDHLHPTSVAFDLDPSAPGFEPVREVALALHAVLSRLDLPHVAKTSGATGLQVFIPLTPGHSFAETRLFTKTVAEYLHKQRPDLVTLERLTRKRGHKVYVDYPQHGKSRTLIAPYSSRATSGATVSTPLSWEEVEQGAVPEQFTILNVPKRLQDQGDRLARQPRVSLHEVTTFLKRRQSTQL